jgi:acyl-ACP thioesterase
MSTSHREHFTVRSYEVDPDGRLRVVALLRMLQEAAWQHASILGKGFHHREEGALFWVLARLRLRVDRYPRWGDDFTIRTYPVGTEKLLALREFALHDASDAVIGRAASAWLVVDGGTGRPVRPQPMLEDIVLSEPELDVEREFSVGLGREKGVDAQARSDPGEVRRVGPHPVHYHDIDQYRHVNNAAYLEWVVDAVDPARPMDSAVHTLAIDFLKETLLDDSYTVRLRSDGGPTAPTDRFEVVRASDGEAAVRGRIEWRPRS